jgi:hypothetical protein
MKTKISSTLAWIIKLAISASVAVIMNIKNDRTRIVLSSLLMSADQVVQALSDGDTDDDAQMTEILNNIIVQSELSILMKQLLAARLAMLKPPFNDISQTMADLSFSTADLLTDDNPANKDQANSLFGDFFRGPDGLMFIIKLIKITPLDDASAAIIASAIAEFVSRQFPGDAKYASLLELISKENQIQFGVSLKKNPFSTIDNRIN